MRFRKTGGDLPPRKLFKVSHKEIPTYKAVKLTILLFITVARQVMQQWPLLFGLLSPRQLYAWASFPIVMRDAVRRDVMQRAWSLTIQRIRVDPCRI